MDTKQNAKDFALHSEFTFSVDAPANPQAFDANSPQHKNYLYTVQFKLFVLKND